MISKQTALPVVVVLAAAFSAVFGVQAQTLGQHPAVLAHQAARTIDPNTFIVAHPAHVTVKSGHAGHEHPALSISRDASATGVDANTFLVQPPASTTWTHGAAPTALLALTHQR